MLSIGALHFLRPMWFFAFVPVLVMGYFFRVRVCSGGSWQSVCDAHLLPHLLHDASGENNKRWYLIVLVWCLFIIALSGPSWHKKPQAVFQSQAATVIVLDLSRSMNADDIKPSRLARAKFKVLDLLKKHKAGQVGLIVFSKEPYVVSPLTQDSDTIAAMMPAIQTSLMPSQGHDVAFALRKAASLLKQGSAMGGHVILLTSGRVFPRDIDEAKRLVKKKISIDVLGVGTPEGAPLQGDHGFLKDQQGGIVMSALDVASLKHLAKQGGGDYVFFSDDNSDVKHLVNNVNNIASSSVVKKSDQALSLWVDEGYWFLLLAVVLMSKVFQRNWFLGIRS